MSPRQRPDRHDRERPRREPDRGAAGGRGQGAPRPPGRAGPPDGRRAEPGPRRATGRPPGPGGVGPGRAGPARRPDGGDRSVGDDRGGFGFRPGPGSRPGPGGPGRPWSTERPGRSWRDEAPPSAPAPGRRTPTGPPPPDRPRAWPERPGAARPWPLGEVPSGEGQHGVPGPTGHGHDRRPPARPGGRPPGRPAGRPAGRPLGRPPARGSGEWSIRPAVADAEQLASGEELIAGRRPVEEAFAARRASIRLLVTPGRRQALERIVLHATTLRIPIVEVEGGSLTALAGFDGHQGIALVVEARRFATLQDVLARAIERGEPPFVLVLDSLEDPQNLGTVLRSAEAAGVHGVVFPTVRQAPLSPAGIKASAGATEHLLLCPVDDLAGALTDLHVRGLRVVGTEADAPLTARQADLRGPIAIVVGSEGHGLSPTVRRRCDLMVRIPMRGAIGSLNAAVAGSVLLFEAVGQRDPGGPAPDPGAAPAGPTAMEAAPDPSLDPEAGTDKAPPRRRRKAGAA